MMQMVKRVIHLSNRAMEGFVNSIFPMLKMTVCA